MCFQSIGWRSGLWVQARQSSLQSGGWGSVAPHQRKRVLGHLILPPTSPHAGTCSASPATVNHVTISPWRNPNPCARSVRTQAAASVQDMLKPEASALRIKNGRKWSPCAPCFVISVPLVSLYSAPPLLSPLCVWVNIGKACPFLPKWLQYTLFTPKELTELIIWILTGG